MSSEQIESTKKGKARKDQNESVKEKKPNPFIEDRAMDLICTAGRAGI